MDGDRRVTDGDRTPRPSRATEAAARTRAAAQAGRHGGSRARARVTSADVPPTPPGLDRIAVRRLVQVAPVVRLPLVPGDHALVAAGEAVPEGGILAERVRASALVDVAAAAVPEGALPGAWWEDDGRRHGVRRVRPAADEGELLYRTEGEWRVVRGDRGDLLEAPAGGIVREVSAGVGIALETGCHGLVAVAAIGGPARGPLEVVGDAHGELRAGALDVGRAGAIVVAGSRVDAETLTRARAMGIRGIVAAGVATRHLRDIAASEARQRASLQALPPFAILVLEGNLRARIASPVMAILAALAGRDVAIVGDPPLLLFGLPRDGIPRPPADLVRIRHGSDAGREGRWAGPAGRRRFAAGVHLDAGFVATDRGVVVVPLSDLERFG